MPTPSPSPSPASRRPLVGALFALSWAGAPGCAGEGGSGASPALSYAQAIEAVAADPSTSARVCRGVVDPILHADCITAGVEAMAAEDLSAATSLCEGLPDGAGKDECFFQAAEAGKDPATCARAGRFDDDCRMHLWTTALLQGLPRATLPAEADAPVEALLVGHTFGPEDGRPWVAVYRTLLGGRRPFDRALCDGISHPERRTICRDAGRDLYNDLLNNARDTGRFPCAGGPLPPMLAHTEDPELEALIDARREGDLCPAP